MLIIASETDLVFLMLEIFELYENTFKNGIRRAQAGLAASILDVDDVRSGLQEAEEELAKMNYEYSSTRNPQMKAKVRTHTSRSMSTESSCRITRGTCRNKWTWCRLTTCSMELIEVRLYKGTLVTIS